MGSRPIEKAVGFLATLSIRAWMRTLDYRAAFYDRTVDPSRGEGEPRIYVFWHEYILAPLYLRGRCNVAMLLSRHRDADILEQVAGHFGFECIRGSTYRGASTAIRELMRKGHTTHLAITPDGPRGPRRQLAQGAIYLASRLGMPLVAFGLGYNRPWRVRSWDRFAIPRPYARVRGVIGPAIHVPPNLDRAGIEFYRHQIERFLLQLTDEAEAWAEAGTRKVEEMTARPEGAQRRKGTANGPESGRSVNRMHVALEPAGRRASCWRLAG